MMDRASAAELHRRLGEWLEIGGAVEAASRDESAILSARSSASARTGRVWLRVDELKP